MLTLRLPVDDQRQGLAERPHAFAACAETASVTSTLSGGDGTLAYAFELDQEAMGQQLEIVCRYGIVIERIAARHGLLPSIIAGFCSRRSGWGSSLSPTGIDGTRDFEPRGALQSERCTPLPPDGLGFKRGLMGLDYDRHELARSPHWRDPERNIESAFALIDGYRTTLRRQTTLQGAGLLRASLSAFECGIERVQRALRHGEDVDSPTLLQAGSSRGCGRDVLARAGFFQTQGWD